MRKEEKARILEELGDLSEEIYDELVGEFIEMVKVKVLEMKRLMGEGNFTELSKHAHFVKGASLNLRIPVLHEIARNIEIASKMETAREKVPAYMEELEMKMQELCDSSCISSE
jgi:HPt (histidine-containing phosphotransfer) domain-containing protein